MKYFISVQSVHTLLVLSGACDHRSIVESLGGDAASRVWAGDWSELEPGLQG